MADDLEMRRKRIRVRAWRRGMRELDLLMGRFVDAAVETFDARDVADFEALLDVADQTALEWLVGDTDPPPEFDTPVFRRLKAFAGGDR